MRNLGLKNIPGAEYPGDRWWIKKQSTADLADVVIRLADCCCPGLRGGPL